MLDKYKDKYVFIEGFFDVKNVAISYGYKKILDTKDLYAIYPLYENYYNKV